MGIDDLSEFVFHALSKGSAHSTVCTIKEGLSCGFPISSKRILNRINPAPNRSLIGILSNGYLRTSIWQRLRGVVRVRWQINTLWVGVMVRGGGVSGSVPCHVWRQAGRTGDTVHHESRVAADQGRHVSQGESSLIR